MPVHVKNPTKAQVEQLRNLFIDKYEQKPPEVSFHPIDLHRLRNDDLWCRRFLEMYDLDMDVALAKLWETCIWRQKYGANTLTEENLNKEYLYEGSIFVHNTDIDGMPLLIFKTKLHNKNKNIDELLKIIVYWVERTQRDRYLTKLTIFFDMSGTGLSNLDIDFVKRIIELFKLYYPNTLNYILVYELAWILNAAFKVIKSILPPKAVEILKMITKKDINTYVLPNNCLTCWGGTDSYEYSFVPEKPISQVTARTNGVNPDNGEESNSGLDKKVTFNNCDPTHIPYTDEFQDLNLTDNHEMLRIDSPDVINFQRGDSKESTFTVTNVYKIPVTYKIQTTSPEKFRVRPRCGVLGAGDSIDIGILLKAEHMLSESSKDKFLVLGMPTATTDMSPTEVSELWKRKPITSPDVEQHRLVCQYVDGAEGKRQKCDEQMNADTCSYKPPGAGAGRNIPIDPQFMQLTQKPSSNDMSEKLLKQTEALQRQVKFTQTLQYLMLGLLAMLFVGFLYLMSTHPQLSTCDQTKAFGCKTCP